MEQQWCNIRIKKREVIKMLKEIARGYYKIEGVDGGFFKNMEGLWQANLNNKIICKAETLNKCADKFMRIIYKNK